MTLLRAVLTLVLGAFLLVVAGHFNAGLFLFVAAIATMLLAPLEDDEAEDAEARNAPWRLH